MTPVVDGGSTNDANASISAGAASNKTLPAGAVTPLPPGKDVSPTKRDIARGGEAAAGVNVQERSKVDTVKRGENSTGTGKPMPREKDNLNNGQLSSGESSKVKPLDKVVTSNTVDKAVDKAQDRGKEGSTDANSKDTPPVNEQPAVKEDPEVEAAAKNKDIQVSKPGSTATENIQVGEKENLKAKNTIVSSKDKESGTVM